MRALALTICMLLGQALGQEGNGTGPQSKFRTDSVISENWWCCRHGVGSPTWHRRNP